MLISCTSCNSNYLVNSADLKPSGRTVQCAKCGNKWYQDTIFNTDSQNKEEFTLSASSRKLDQENNFNSQIPNLPSTYVKEKNVSILNSILVVLFVIFFISGFWIIRNLDLNSLILLKFYINEFTFNLKLIFDDIAKIIYQIIN